MVKVRVVIELIDIGHCSSHNLVLTYVSPLKCDGMLHFKLRASIITASLLPNFSAQREHPVTAYCGNTIISIRMPLVNCVHCFVVARST